jgi:amidohydrolase
MQSLSLLLPQIRQLSEQFFEDSVADRRHLHQHPELSFEEEKSSRWVRERLASWGIESAGGVGGHGVVALIEGQRGPGATVALRADMDALPIQEENEVLYRSQRPGVMHACGHDAHTASLLGSARILQQLRGHFAGSIKLIFQPAEERFPGGASLMIADGVLQAPAVDAILGQHVLPFLDAGKIGIRSGVYMASADEIYIRVQGKGGHAAHPAHFIDPVMITAQMLVALQQLVSRSDPRTPSILSFGRVIAEGATNIIPGHVNLEGTFRTMNESWREEAHGKIRRIASSVAEAFGGHADIDIKRGYPVLVNHEALAARTRESIEAYAGPENVVDLDLWMASEDFAYYTHQVPGCFYRLGTRNEAAGIVHGLHTPRFDIDEQALRLSTGLMAWIALCELENTLR